jgi:hypothetical protein
MMGWGVDTAPYAALIALSIGASGAVWARVSLSHRRVELEKWQVAWLRASEKGAIDTAYDHWNELDDFGGSVELREEKQKEIVNPRRRIWGDTLKRWAMRRS